MPDLYDPIATQQTQVSAIEELTDFKTDLLARANLQLWLYTNNLAPSPTNTLANFTEANFGGYARKTISAFTGPYLDANNNAYMQTALQTYTANGGVGNTIYGALLVATNAAGVQAVATNAGNAGAYASLFTISNAGSGYQVAPHVSLTGATGSGATAHAVITNGVVTSVVLDTPGSAYTTYVVVIDPPLELIQQSQLTTSGISMALATDALPTYAQLNLPSISVNNP